MMPMIVLLISLFLAGCSTKVVTKLEYIPQKVYCDVEKPKRNFVMPSKKELEIKSKNPQEFIDFVIDGLLMAWADTDNFETAFNKCKENKEYL